MAQAGRYHITRKIADGGMAEIFLGMQHGVEGFERPVVLKRILAPLVADPQFRNMLIDEAHVAMGLNHSNIVQVLDLGHMHGRYFLVMEFVDGWDLSQILARATNAKFPLPAEIALYIAAEICRALAYAHSRTRAGEPLALVHRDVSPQNVLISEQGEVKLTDFGIAKAMGRREHTNQGVIKGKLAFMSPEQASGAVLDNRSDLFALGTMLYQFFTGRRPFDAPTDLESIMLVRQCRFTPPDQLRPDLHPEMISIIKRALQAKPADRFQTAEELMLAIEKVQRTAFKPAGQTELKRWLAELQAKDGIKSIGRTEGPKAASTAEEELDVGVGADVVFDQSDLMEVSEIMRGIQPTIAATPPPPGAAEAAAAAKTTLATPSAIRRSGTRSRLGGIAIGLFLVAAATAAWFVFNGSSDEGSKPVRAARGSRVEARPSAEGAHEPATSPREARTEPPTLAADEAKKPDPTKKAATPASIDASAMRAEEASPGKAVPSGTTAAQEDEEDLLKNAEPESTERVIGEDDAVPAPPTKKSRPAVAKAPATFEPVSVYVASYPDGAVISLGRRVFGRAPMNLRFRPGISYELRFVKKGYQTASKRFTPSARKNQSVRVALKKKPEPHRSILRRIFGR